MCLCIYKKHTGQHTLTDSTVRSHLRCAKWLLVVQSVDRFKVLRVIVNGAILQCSSVHKWHCLATQDHSDTPVSFYLHSIIVICC